MKMDHVAIQVDDVRESVDWYVERFGCSIIYCDHTWALLQFDNIKLALVVEDQHPFHIAFETDDLLFGGSRHRDGSYSVYVDDPTGNKVEVINYEQ